MIDNNGIHRVLKLLKCLLFYSSSMTFGLFYFISIVLKVYSFPSLVPSSH